MSFRSGGNGNANSSISQRAAFEPEAIRNMAVVFESVCAELGLSDKDDSATRLVASKIVEFAQSGVLDITRLRSMTRKEFKLE